MLERKLIVQEWMAFDGVIEAPGDPDEDRSGGFEHGGWHLEYFDEPSMNWVVSNLNAAGGFVLGRRTYEGSPATGRTRARKSNQ